MGGQQRVSWCPTNSAPASGILPFRAPFLSFIFRFTPLHMDMKDCIGAVEDHFLRIYFVSRPALGSTFHVHPVAAATYRSTRLQLH